MSGRQAVRNVTYNLLQRHILPVLGPLKSPFGAMEF
jgi:hypothetical protein